MDRPTRCPICSGEMDLRGNSGNSTGLLNGPSDVCAAACSVHVPLVPLLIPLALHSVKLPPPLTRTLFLAVMWIFEA
nr:hypothetical protein [Sapientia aquatica]